jgi:pimeloyl-ACP methyl ester carboxylesterase
MPDLQNQGFRELGGARLEYRHVGPQPDAAPTLVLLHEGLGSAGLWGDFPDKLAARTGAGVFAYSRAGYGRSSPAGLPRPLTYMQDEAETLASVLDAIGFRRGLLVGHSDGASIATLYFGAHQDHRVRGVSMIAPHFVVEDMTVAAIADAKKAFETGDLKGKLARWHDDVDNAFRGWNDAWLDPDFRRWDISDSLGYIRVPVQIVQGEADPYGSLRQIAIAEEECYCPVDVTILPGIGHAPHREAPEATLDAVAEFVNRILTMHGEREMQQAA